MQIKWDNSLSEPFNVCNGVRQGNVLFPFLFNVYLDDLLGDRRDSGAGAKIGNMFLGCLAYADDSLLISPTAAGLQKVMDICLQYANVHHLKVNGKKSSVIGFIKRVTSSRNIPEFPLNGISLSCHENINHLGVVWICWVVIKWQWMPENESSLALLTLLLQEWEVVA